MFRIKSNEMYNVATISQLFPFPKNRLPMHDLCRTKVNSAIFERVQHLELFENGTNNEYYAVDILSSKCARKTRRIL